MPPLMLICRNVFSVTKICHIVLPLALLLMFCRRSTLALSSTTVCVQTTAKAISTATTNPYSFSPIAIARHSQTTLWASPKHSLDDQTSTQSTSAVLDRRKFISFGISSSTASISSVVGSSLMSKPANAETTTTTTTTTLKRRNKSLEEALSGFTAGAALSTAKTLVKYPLDTATVRLQRPDTPYRLSIDLFEGSFRGIVTPLLSNIPAGAIFFAVKDATKALLKENVLSLSLSPYLLTTLSVAAALPPYWLIRNPSEVVKTRQQAGMEGYGEGVSALQAYQRLWNEQQQLVVDTDTTDSKSTTNSVISAFYTGYWENIAYGLPADVIKFLVYDSLTKNRDKKSLSPLEGAVSGAMATAVAQLLTTPLDVVRNRVMMRSDQQQQQQNNTDATPTYWQSLRTLAQEEGLEGLFAGASPRVGKAILSGAIQFATYEETKASIARMFDKK